MAEARGGRAQGGSAPAGIEVLEDRLLLSGSPLQGDLNGDGFVGVGDLNIVLGNWNLNVPPANPAADPTGDGFVGLADLGQVLGNWNAGTPYIPGPPLISGELKKWHKITIDFDGPLLDESGTPNPFTDYRLDVTFSHAGSGKQYVVPGYFAADGDAGNTHATSGRVWRVHFAPDEIGEWTFSASFRTGGNIAVATDPMAGVSAGFFDGETGNFSVAPTDKTGIDLRGKGRLEYIGQRYLQFAETGEYFLKQGPDAPENLLAYADFDGPFKSDGNKDNLIKDWQPHVADWQPGDPTWDSEDADTVPDDGKGLIGAINYLASEGLNAFSFLTMNIAGDDQNVFMYTDYNERLRMDISRLDQWEKVFEHADTKGMYLHFKTQETENDQLLDGGALGTQRRLYYRELIARFSHHLALNWNLGEENTNTTQQRKDFAQFFYDNDPYRHPIVLHTFPNQKDAVYDPLLGNASKLTGASLQTGSPDFSQVHGDTLTWVNKSTNAGKPWVVAVDEPGDAQHALRPDNDAGNSHEDGRKNALWGTLMAGGAGNEWYFGYAHAHSDLTLNDFRSRDNWWDYTRYALQFFNDNNIPFWEMQPDDAISTATNDYGFYKPGEVYVAYLKNGGTTNIDLSAGTGTFEVKWFDPRNGGALQDGTVTSVSGGGVVGVGLPPNNTTQDWVVLVRKQVATSQAPFQNMPNQIFDGSRIQFEHYDIGGEGLAYHDTDTIGQGSPARGEAVDGGATTGAVGERIGWIADGEWLEYTVDVTAGTYFPTIRYAAGAATVGDIRLLIGDGPDGTNFTELATIDLQNTGGWNNWAFLTAPPVAFNGGNGQVLRVEMIGGGFDLDFIEFTSGLPVNTPPTITLDSITQVVQETGAAGVFQDQGGYVVMEVESHEPTDIGDWVLRNTDPTGATGAGFYEWQGPNLFSSPGSGVLTYRFRVEQAGTYQMRIRNHRTISSGEAGDQENDVFAKMDNGAWIKVYSGQMNQWNWASNFDFHDTKPPASYDLTAGEHTFYLSGRSQWFRIDRIALFLSSQQSVAQNIATPEAPRSSGAANVLGYQIETTVDDDARNTYPPVLQWSKVSGPGAVTFDDTTAEDVFASFAVDGTYTLRLLAFDGQHFASQDVVINATSVPNQAPVVDAGLDQTIKLPTDTVILDATVTDDGLPTGTVTSSWSVTSAPAGATVTFGDASAVDTLATFSDAGTYVLRLTADDGERSSFDEVTITVNNEFDPLAFSPTDDAYLENSTPFDNQYLKVENASRVRTSFIKFNVTGLSGGAISNATLRLKVDGDPGNGTINVYAGSHNNWTETTLTSANSPAAGSLLDSVSGNYTVGQWLEFDVSSLIAGNGVYTFVIEIAPGGNDVWFSSREGIDPPELLIVEA